MALFLILSESWQSFCQTVQQTFPMREKTLPDRKFVFQNPDKKEHFKRKVKKSLLLQHHFGNPAPNRD